MSLCSFILEWHRLQTETWTYLNNPEQFWTFEDAVFEAYQTCEDHPGLALQPYATLIVFDVFWHLGARALCPASNCSEPACGRRWSNSGRMEWMSASCTGSSFMPHDSTCVDFGCSRWLQLLLHWLLQQLQILQLLLLLQLQLLQRLPKYRHARRRLGVLLALKCLKMV